MMRERKTSWSCSRPATERALSRAGVAAGTREEEEAEESAEEERGVEEWKAARNGAEEANRDKVIWAASSSWRANEICLMRRWRKKWTSRSTATVRSAWAAQIEMRKKAATTEAEPPPKDFQTRGRRKSIWWAWRAARYLRPTSHQVQIFKIIIIIMSHLTPISRRRSDTKTDEQQQQLVPPLWMMTTAA